MHAAASAASGRSGALGSCRPCTGHSNRAAAFIHPAHPSATPGKPPDPLPHEVQQQCRPKASESAQSHSSSALCPRMKRAGTPKSRRQRPSCAPPRRRSRTPVRVPPHCFHVIPGQAWSPWHYSWLCTTPHLPGYEVQTCRIVTRALSAAASAAAAAATAAQLERLCLARGIQFLSLGCTSDMRLLEDGCFDQIAALTDHTSCTFRHDLVDGRLACL